MRKVCLVAVGFVLFVCATRAQPLQLSLMMSPNPSPYLSDWGQRRETVILSVTNTQQNPFAVRIRARVFQGGPTGTLLAETKVQEMPMLQIPPGASIFDGGEIVPGEAVKFYGNIEGQAAQTGRLPGGQYTLCVDLVDAEQGQPLSQQKCVGFNITLHLPPQLYSPQNNAALTLDQLRTEVFRWSRESPPVTNSRAEFVVVEYREGQPLWQTLSANIPVYRGEVIPGLTQLQWPPDVMLTDKQYVWSVRIVDDQGRGATEPEWAEPFLFSVKPDTQTTPANCANPTVNLRLSRGVGEPEFLRALSFSPTEIESQPISATAFPVNSLVHVSATHTEDPECIVAMTWNVNKISSSGADRSSTMQGREIRIDNNNGDGAQTRGFNFFVTSPGIYEITSKVFVARKEDAQDMSRITTVERTVTFEAGSSTVPNDSEKGPCTITILGGGDPCDGSVETEHSGETISITIVVDGPLTPVTVTIRENPCGTYDPPYSPTPPTPSGGGTTITPSGGGKTTPSEGGEKTTAPKGPITQEKYEEKHRKTITSPVQGANTMSIPVGSMIIPGGAYVIEATGICTNVDGTTSTVSAVPVCNRYRPMTTTTTRDGGSYPVPVTIPDCPDTTVGDACGPSYTSEPATPIEATIELKDADTYPYPRAAPLRANTIDYDYAVFLCSGCGGIGQEYRPIRDLADIIAWELKGKGSLNIPFDGSAMKAADDAIDELSKKLALVEDSLAAMRDKRTKAVDKFKKDLEDAKTQLAKREDESKVLKDTLAIVVKQLDSLKTAIDSIADKMDSLSTAAAKWRDTARITRDSVRRYDSLLTDPPGATEIALLKKVGTTNDAFESAESALQDLQRSIATESIALQKAIRSADSLLIIAQAYYKTKQDASGVNTRKVADIQNDEYKTAELKKYRVSRRDLQTQQSTFESGFVDATGHPLLAARIQKMLDDAYAALLTKDAKARKAYKKSIDSLSPIIMSSLVGSCGGVKGAANKSACEAVAGELSLTVDRFTKDIDDCITTGQKLTPGMEAKIAKARLDLTSQEAGLVAAASAVKSASDVHKAALSEYKSRMTTLDASRATALKDAETKQAANTEAQRVYQAEREKRDSLFRINQPLYLDRRADFAERRDSALKAIDDLALVFGTSREDSIAKAAELVMRRSDTSAIGDSIRVLAADIAKLRAFLRMTEKDITKPFDDIIARLAKDSTAIAEELKKRKKDREDIGKGTKGADGEFVYYIPPPLEEIMDEAAKKRFEDLKDSVAAAEGRVKAALASKESLQGQLVRMVEGISGDLSDIKNFEFQISSAEDEVKNIDSDLADKKNELAKDYRESHDKVDDERVAAEAEEKSADAKMVEAAAAAAALAAELEVRRTELNSALSSLSAARAAVKDAIETRASRAATVQTSANSATGKADALNADKKELRSAERTTRKGKDQTRRAMARENLPMETSARATVNASAAVVKSKQTDIDTKKASLVALSKELGLKFDDLVKGDTVLAKALKDFVKSDDAAKVKKKSYDITYDKFEREMQRIEYWRGVRDKAETRMDENAQVLEDMPAADDVTTENDDVKAGTERKEALEAEIAAVTKQIAAFKKSIGDALKEKDKIVKDADKEIDDAKKNLETKNEELKAFLVKAFNTVKHTDTLLLTVNDVVVDGFRAGDPEKKIECYISYDGTRTPKMICPDLAGAAPPVKKVPGPCIPDVSPLPAGPVTGTDPSLFKKEPRTIALVYKEGKPLWKEWPVIKETKTLAKDVVVILGTAKDADQFVIACKPTVYLCKAGPPLIPGVIDLASRTWIKHDGAYRHIVDRSPYVLWEPDKVPVGVCKNEQMVEAEYRANEVAPDPTDTKNSKHNIEPGVLIEVPDSLVGWPKKIDTVVARIVTGDHKGLDGEDIVMSVKLVSGKSEDWGLDGKKKEVTRKTDGDGYVKIPFEYGDGYARFEIEVKWSRPDTCKRETLAAVAPLLLRFHRLGNAPPTLAWKAAEAVWGGGEGSVDGVLAGMTAVTEDENPYEKKIHGVAGFLDEQRAFVDGQLMRFTPVSPKFTVDPTEEKTALFGIARTEVVEEIKKGAITLKAECEDSLRPLCRPPEEKRTYDPSGEKKFKIGSVDDPFAVEMEEGFDPSDEISGTGRLVIDSPNEFLKSLIGLPVTVSGVALDKDLVATKGAVTWSTGGLSASAGSFTFELTEVMIRAQGSARIDGTIKHKSLENAINFNAELSTDGEFYGEASNLPSITFADFTLRQGAAVAVDFHSALPEKTPLGSAFKGIVIGKAEVEFPKAFNAGKTDAPTVLSATDLAIGDGGVTGTLAIEGGPLAMSFASFSLSVSSLSVTFEASKVKGAEIKGAFSMEKPFTGTINSTISFSDTWIATFDTESSITIPRWKAAVAILPGTTLEYDPAKSLGTFTLIARISSDRFGTIDIDELIVSSDGKFSVKGGVRKDVDIKILKGFDLHLTGVEILASNDEFELQIHGGIGIPGIGLKSLEGSLIVKPGPEVDVAIKGGEITIEKGPFELKGTFAFKENEFYAKLSVEIKNVLKGIEGEIFVGTQPTEDNNTYTYWYVGLAVSVAIPLGQSGVAITEIGGGIGWNCIPPIGSERPTPKNFDNIALRASVGVGNLLPLGKIFNSRFTMVYAPGSITLAGEAWLLDQQENIVGQGRLTVAWEPAMSISGNVQARVALPDNEGKILLMRGKVDFLFTDSKFEIASEYLDASFLSFLNANASFEVTTKKGFLKGKVWYEVEKSVDIVVAKVAAEINMKAGLDISYVTSPSVSLAGSIDFSGSAKLVASSGPFTWDIASAKVTCGASVFTSGSTFKMSGTVKAYASVLGFSGNIDYDVGVEV